MILQQRPQNIRVPLKQILLTDINFIHTYAFLSLLRDVGSPFFTTLLISSIPPRRNTRFAEYQYYTKISPVQTVRM